MSAVRNNSDWKDGFLFVGNELVLDFLNTRPVQNCETRELIGDFDALLRWFRAADVLNAQELSRLKRRWRGTSKAQKATEAMRQLRENLRAQIMAWEAGGALRPSIMESLNAKMAENPMGAKLTVRGNAYSTVSQFDLREPGDLFGPLAYSAAKLFSQVDRKRVRKCNQCVLHFHDTSKKGTRRWCSMNLCGNRLKVAAYAARRRRGR